MVACVLLCRFSHRSNARTKVSITATNSVTTNGIYQCVIFAVESERIWESEEGWSRSLFSYLGKKRGHYVPSSAYDSLPCRGKACFRFYFWRFLLAQACVPRVCMLHAHVFLMHLYDWHGTVIHNLGCILGRCFND